MIWPCLRNIFARRCALVDGQISDVVEMPLNERFFSGSGSITITIKSALSGETICSLQTERLWRGRDVKSHIVGAARDASLEEMSIRLLYAEHEIADEDLIADLVKEKDATLFLVRRTIECVEWLKAHSRGQAVLSEAGVNIQNDRECVTTAVRRNGRHLQFAPAFSDDEDVVLVAITESGSAMQFASARLQTDVDFVLKSLRYSRGSALLWVPPELRSVPAIQMYAQLQRRHESGMQSIGISLGEVLVKFVCIVTLVAMFATSVLLSRLVFPDDLDTDANCEALREWLSELNSPLPAMSSLKCQPFVLTAALFSVLGAITWTVKRNCFYWTTETADAIYFNAARRHAIQDRGSNRSNTRSCLSKSILQGCGLFVACASSFGFLFIVCFVPLASSDRSVSGSWLKLAGVWAILVFELAAMGSFWLWCDPPTVLRRLPGNAVVAPLGPRLRTLMNLPRHRVQKKLCCLKQVGFAPSRLEARSRHAIQYRGKSR